MKLVRHILLIVMSLGIGCGVWATAQQQGGASVPLHHADIGQAHGGPATHGNPLSRAPMMAFEIGEDEDENHDRQPLLVPVMQFEHVQPRVPLAARRHCQLGAHEGANYLKYHVLRL